MTKPKRIAFLNVPVDFIDNDTTNKLIEEYLQNGHRRYIVLLTIEKLLKARVDNEYNRYLREAALILPVSLGIINGIRFHRKETITRYNPYELIIRIFMIAEKTGKSVYILGSHTEDLLEAERNLKVSFPQIKFIGRCSGYFNSEKENDIILAVRKSSPALIALGKGLPGNEKWIFRNIKYLSSGLFFWIDNYLEIFSGKEKNLSKPLFNLGLESIPGILRRPWKIFKVFPYLYFKILVLIFKITGQ